MRAARRFAGRLVRSLSIQAVHQTVAASADLDRHWQSTLRLFPSFREHFSSPVDDTETQVRIRFLVAAECAFVESEIAAVLAGRPRCTYADIGDSDGSVRVIMEERFGRDRLSTVGINLQPGVVERMQQRGLDALCADAIDVGNRGQSYDVVSLFETMEHLPDPIGFLQKIAPVVGDRLVLSVPYLRKSRVGLAYLRSDWPQGQPVTIENVHIFELSPEDWRKLFSHAGWRVERETVVTQFPSRGPLKWLLSPYWRYTSFEGFYFVSLSRDTTFSSRYHIG